MTYESKYVILTIIRYKSIFTDRKLHHRQNLGLQILLVL